jgi:homopolymeric O-antigen transport system ATP-binding protein
MRTGGAIEVRDLGKRFEIGAEQGGAQLLTEKISERVKSLGRRPKTTEFWALRDVSFDVAHGESVGVIGHNGAGKSTLFKILSRVTYPTVGEARLRGRVGALLEVGTGFHPELTGRENVFLNGAILNMTRADIARRFDEIVEFADIGPFLDTPVKRYSSGMQLRLAFSVAAHLEPEILIVDEVLAVGDTAFQQKCLGRMENASREGRTVLFISHNLATVQNLCDRAIMLADGQISAVGKTHEVIEAYVAGITSETHLSLRERENRTGTGRVRLTDLRFERAGQPVDALITGADQEIVLTYETLDGQPAPGANFGITVAVSGGSTQMLNMSSETTGALFRNIPARGEVRCRLPRLPLPAGQYYLNAWADFHGETLDMVPLAAEVTVAAGDFHGTGRAPPPEQRTVLVDHSWSLNDASPTPEVQRSSSLT